MRVCQHNRADFFSRWLWGFLRGTKWLLSTWRGKLAVSWTYWWRIWVGSTTEGTSTTLRFFSPATLDVLDFRCGLDFLFFFSSNKLPSQCDLQLVWDDELHRKFFVKLCLCSLCLVPSLHRVWCPTWHWGETHCNAGPCTAWASIKRSARAFWVNRKLQAHPRLVISPFRPSMEGASSFLTASQTFRRTPSSNLTNGGRQVRTFSQLEVHGN